MCTVMENESRLYRLDKTIPQNKGTDSPHAEVIWHLPSADELSFLSLSVFWLSWSPLIERVLSGSLNRIGLADARVR